MTKYLVLLSSFLLLAVVGHKVPTPATSFFVADSILTHVYQEFDSNGVLDNYHARVFTPVCEVERCYAIEIDLYWDLTGRFIAFDTIQGQGLTKLDHIPLTESDYERLREILLDPNSILASYSKEELVKSTRTSDLDGMTGATIKEVKDLVIDGAVYTCYTLWHITHGPVTDSLRIATSKSLNQALVTKLVNMKDQDVNYFLLNHFSEEDFVNYLPLVLTTIDHGEGYYAKNAIERMPAKTLSDTLAQNYFVRKFDELNYFSQVALLKKLQQVPVYSPMRKLLEEQLDERSSYKNELIQSLLSDN